MNWFGRHHHSHKSHSTDGRATHGRFTPGRSTSRHSSQDHAAHRQSVRERRADYLAASGYKPLIIAAAVVGAALVAGGTYRYLKPGKRKVYKSRSRRPQISRWESEGGDVPQVQSLEPRRTH